MRKTKHTYTHIFASGNIGILSFRLPLPTKFTIKWLRPASAADVTEYRGAWSAAIAADLTVIDGRPHQLTDNTARAATKRPATVKEAA
jgi:hypothetical protein